MRYNELTGPIPSEIGLWTDCYQLILSQGDGNVFTGTMPSELANLQKLEFLTLESSSITGTIPTGLASIKTVEKF